MNEKQPYKRYSSLKDVIGRGGASDRIEKWTDTVSGKEIAVKIVPQRLDHLALQEIEALQEVKRARVSRVANLLDHLKGSDGSTDLVLELVVNGFNMYEYSEWRKSTVVDWNIEGKMLTVAVQLTEMLSELHSAHIAHLDIKGDNIMLTQNFDHPWDTLRVIDFAMAVRSSPDCLVRDVLPQGHAFGASAPELMSAAAKVSQGLLDDDLKINGCAADMWSAGTVLYEMLTGHRAFNPTLPEGNIPPAQGQHDWTGTVLRQTNFVRDSISNAKSHSDLMEHPMFSKIAHCSSRPDLAVGFFRGLFEDSPTKRMTAIEAFRHPYLQDCVLEMQKARQGNSTYKNTSGYRQPPQQRRAGGLSRLKKMFSSKASAERHPDRSQQASPPPDLDWFFPPYEIPRNR